MLTAGQGQELLEGLLLGLIFALGQLLEHHLAFEDKILSPDFGL